MDFSPLILGLDWLRENEIIIDCGKNTVYTKCVRKEMEGEGEQLVDMNEREVMEYKGKVMFLTTKGENGRRLIERLEEGQRADVKWRKIIQKMGGQMVVRQRAKKYCLHAGLLFLEKKEARNKWVLCIPEKEVKNVLKECHDEKLHPGINKMQKMLSNLIVWTGMTRDIRKYVR